MKKLFSGKKKGSASSSSSTRSSLTMSSSASSSSSSGVAPHTPTGSITPTSVTHTANSGDNDSISGSTLKSPSQGVITPSVSTLSIADTDVTLSGTAPMITDIHLSTLSTTLPNGTTSRTLISLTPPTSSSRQPITLMCVIDISGSMSTVANIKTNENGVETTENDGLSVLDVVKHAMRTIIASLGAKDKLGIVTFSDSARVDMEICGMDEAGKKKAGDVVEKMKVEGMTNLWDGIKTGLNELGKEKKKHKSGVIDCVTSLFVLTDGLPNVEPPRGSVAMLKSYFDGHEEVRGVSVSTFGFGYSLDSQILLELSEVGRGGFVFIPDAGMVGTGFINALANAFVTMAVNAVLSVEVEEGVELVSQGKRLKTVDGQELERQVANVAETAEEEEWVLGGYEFIKTSWGIQIYLGTIQYGQGKDVVLEFAGPAIKEGKSFINLELTYELCYPTAIKAVSSNGISYPPQPATEDALSLISYHHSRLTTVDTVNTILRTKSTFSGAWPTTASNKPSKFSQYLTKSAIEPIKNSPSSSSSSTKALLADLTGQFTLALSKEAFFRKWGKHYLRSLSRAHLLQNCSNFKDPGIQVYGGATFRTLREKLDTIFDSLPPPKPSAIVRESRFSSSGSPVATRSNKSFNMSRYNRSYAPCFAGEGLVTLSNGRVKMVKDVRKGDRLGSSENGKSRTVRCVLVTRIKEDELDLVSLPSSGLRITPYHPIYSVEHGRWEFPIDISPVKRETCGMVYSFLLDRDLLDGPENHTVTINGVTCVTLGCGIKRIEDGDVRGHPFLGDYEKVVQELNSLDEVGFEMGMVECAGVKRDENDGGEKLAVGFLRVDMHGESDAWVRDKVKRESVRRKGHVSMVECMPEDIVSGVY